MEDCMSYTPPEDVLSPREKVSNLRVIYSGDKGDLAIATMTYGGTADEVGIRWNGDDNDELGYPKSRNQPVWFVVPKKGGLDEIVRWVGEELKAKRPIKPPSLTTDSALEFLTDRGYSVTLKK
jgi:hypothetical protein